MLKPMFAKYTVKEVPLEGQYCADLNEDVKDSTGYQVAMEYCGHKAELHFLEYPDRKALMRYIAVFKQEIDSQIYKEYMAEVTDWDPALDAEVLHDDELEESSDDEADESEAEEMSDEESDDDDEMEDSESDAE